MKNLLFATVLLSFLSLMGCDSQDAESKKFVKQTQEIIKSEYKSSSFEFKKSYYFKDHDNSLSNMGIVCGEVKKKDHDNDYSGYRKYYAVVRGHEGNIAKMLLFKFDVLADASAIPLWLEYCENN
ncbi:hypothetical protein ABN306_11210 [Providencia huaxiensis]|uniref:hypothetical protein n=1 Tax=Providencia huaxiensis TaxID=2027290 RepID=UPI0032DA0496